ncbi:Mrp/NBP35 family ATP-binding protein [Natrinema halophilum]|uniref:Mrp/NBP35 family ATP-binding protein n=1 Tax=Natrinema halophilum TaxID=1699371 RepID=UPI001F23D681|nr:Mrp/NBP35 family ATP-binding protein [Natrinema halophilum]UHQ96276.1 Mrp/NBP35 family ATP-binding protein [Natrinema halophilum]
MTDSMQEDQSDTAEAVSSALAAASIGEDVRFPDVTALEAFDVTIIDDAVIVTVTLPVPSDSLRAVVERDVRRAVQAIDSVSTVECRFEPVVSDPGTRVEFIPDVKNVVAVSSGKGGVGKSTIAVNIATALSEAGASVGLLDADVYGPNAPAMLGLGERKPGATQADEMVPREAHGVKVMSIGFITGEDDPVIWRGPLVDEFIKQLFGDVAWGALDYLIVDMPPGTGDAQLSLIQHLPVTGAVIVTTPQLVALDDARRGLRGFAEYDVPVLGIVENMTSFECPDCGSAHEIFDSGGASRLCEEFSVPLLGAIPLDSAVGTLDGETDDDSKPPGVSVPGIGRLQLPQTRAERERPSSLPPISLRDDGGGARGALNLTATRIAAQINKL